jgi:16S rRNA (guanine527-N7)-methyltransferase
LALALAWPALEADLVEPVGKKAAFLRQSVAELGLAQRVRVHEGRIQEVRLPRAPDLAICRAFASLNEFATLIEPFITPETVVFAMKGQRQEIEAEAAALAPGWRVTDIAALVVPGLGAARHLVELAQPTRTGR